MPERWFPVAREGQLSPGSSLAVTVETWLLALHNIEGRIYCTSNVCPHQGRPLVGGIIQGTRISCPSHAWVFDVTTGACPHSQWTRIPCFPVKIENGEVFVGL